jgi:hypothetical protein
MDLSAKLKTCSPFIPSFYYVREIKKREKCFKGASFNHKKYLLINLKPERQEEADEDIKSAALPFIVRSTAFDD